MLALEVIDNKESFQSLGDRWNDLLSRSASDTIFLTWEWVFNWWQVYGREKELHILILKDQNGALVAIAPFYVRLTKVFKGIQIKEVRFLGSGEDVSPDYLDIIVKKGYENEAIRTILKYLSNDRKWDILNLTDILSTSSILKKLKKSALDNGLTVKEVACAICPYIQLPSSWEDYLARLSKNTRYNVRRRTRNLAKQFNTRFFIWEDIDQLDTAMERLATLHNKRWTEKGSSQSFATEEYNAFHRAVARDFADKGWLHLSSLELDGEIVGIYYDYQYNNKIYYYQGGFDPSLYKYSLGLVLRAYIIEKAIEEGLTEIDLLKGAYDHKYMWTDLDRCTVNLIIGNSRPGSKLFHLDRFKTPQLKAFLKKNIPENIVSLLRKHPN
jgi:CelD/BcsL family acetyltransferase involved in cellulose biosynthesis